MASRSGCDLVIALCLGEWLDGCARACAPDGYSTQERLHAVFMHSACTHPGVDWRMKLENQRGAVLATELKNNANKLAKWTAGALVRCHMQGSRDFPRVWRGSVHAARASPRPGRCHTAGPYWPPCLPQTLSRASMHHACLACSAGRNSKSHMRCHAADWTCPQARRIMPCWGGAAGPRVRVAERARPLFVRARRWRVRT